jgi:flagellar biosynthetic protein FliQ
MNEAQLLDVAREGLVVMLKISAPLLLVGLLVGVVVALFQALTQIQEMTLTFVPKILATFATLLLLLPFMLGTLAEFTRAMLDRAAHGG